MPTFNWVFENQPIESGMLIQLQKSKKQFANRRKRNTRFSMLSGLFIYTSTFIHKNTNNEMHC